ncbi:hypothetical protein LWI28_025137 [Acer negundo]|uniref:Uncharacterized protein n=1 Tax=Acer negundo TaxID=4023 RepID=A0AAD5JMX6_ACENE|nr:hypothetical protein LWI28_025137 [Acer negundo]
MEIVCSKSLSGWENNCSNKLQRPRQRFAMVDGLYKAGRITIQGNGVKGLRSSALLLKRIPLSIPPILISFAAGIRPPLMDVWPEGARKFRRASFEIHSAAGPARDVDLGTNLPSAPTLCVPYC